MDKGKHDSQQLPGLTESFDERDPNAKLNSYLHTSVLEMSPRDRQMVIEHEYVHALDMSSGNFAYWMAKFGRHAANTISEFRAYGLNVMQDKEQQGWLYPQKGRSAAETELKRLKIESSQYDFP